MVSWAWACHGASITCPTCRAGSLGHAATIQTMGKPTSLASRAPLLVLPLAPCAASETAYVVVVETSVSLSLACSLARAVCRHVVPCRAV